MEKRKAPSGFSTRSLLAFEIAGLPGIAGIIVLFIIQPDWPLWLWGLILTSVLVLMLVLYRLFQPDFKCPQCGRVLGQETRLGHNPGDAIRYVCQDCEIDWDTGLHVPTD